MSFQDAFKSENQKILESTTLDIKDEQNPANQPRHVYKSSITDEKILYIYEYIKKQERAAKYKAIKKALFVFLFLFGMYYLYFVFMPWVIGWRYESINLQKIVADRMGSLVENIWPWVQSSLDWIVEKNIETTTNKITQLMQEQIKQSQKEISDELMRNMQKEINAMWVKISQDIRKDFSQKLSQEIANAVAKKLEK